MTGPKTHRTPRALAGQEAAHWLLRLQDTDPDPQDPYFEAAVRHEAFLDWLGEAPEHVQAFLEVFETYRRLGTLDPAKQISIEALLTHRNASVTRIYGTPAPTALAPAPRLTRRTVLSVAAAAAAAVAVVAASWILKSPLFGSPVYTTAVGEQRTCKLKDGSVVYLNTDSRLEVDFSPGARRVRLVRGEALFVVEHDTQRPFIVRSGDTQVRAVGTQFNVRTAAGATDVTVVEGVVQVTVTDASASMPAPSAHSAPSRAGTPADSAATSGAAGPPALANGGRAAPLRLAAGERVEIAEGHLKREKSTDATDVLLWRQRRLKFRDTSLAEAAAEFNRYNDVQIVVDGSVSEDKRLTGIFDADRPQSFVLYAAKDDSLIVEPAGHDWVIRAR
jgi:transmembrane sensor